MGGLGSFVGYQTMNGVLSMNELLRSHYNWKLLKVCFCTVKLFLCLFILLLFQLR